MAVKETKPAAKVAAKPAAKAAEKKPAAKAEAKPAAKAAAKPTKVYHVSQTEDKKAWRVTLSGGSKIGDGKAKIIKTFKTQKEATEYAESLYGGEGTTVLVHKKGENGGGIRKH